ncbi:MAG: ATP-binding protein, partial [Gammaproteobacteria bacterium]
INRSHVSVESILDRSVSSVLPAVSRKRITLERFDVDGLPKIEVDDFRIAQVISNLLTNAIECSSDRGRINVSAELADDAHVCIVIQDFGEGIDAEHLPRIFDRLFQGHVELRTTHGGKGLGLGLSIAREIVALHGGRIEVESDLGAGSTFFVYLPINAPAHSLASSDSQ